MSTEVTPISRRRGRPPGPNSRAGDGHNQSLARALTLLERLSQSPTGMNLTGLWRSVDQENEVFFMFEVEDRGRAGSYMSSPESAAVGREAGVVGGEFHFLSR